VFEAILLIFAFAKGNYQHWREQTYHQSCHLPPKFQDKVIFDRSLGVGDEDVLMEIVDSIEKPFFWDYFADAVNNFLRTPAIRYFGIASPTNKVTEYLKTVLGNEFFEIFWAWKKQNKRVWDNVKARLEVLGDFHVHSEEKKDRVEITFPKNFEFPLTDKAFESNRPPPRESSPLTLDQETEDREILYRCFHNDYLFPLSNSGRIK
jgi:hypothetical protein